MWPRGLAMALPWWINPDGAITYTPALDYRGPDVFQYRVSDFAIAPEVAESATAWVFVTITPVDDVPVANGDDARRWPKTRRFGRQCLATTIWATRIRSLGTARCR